MTRKIKITNRRHGLCVHRIIKLANERQQDKLKRIGHWLYPHKEHIRAAYPDNGNINVVIMLNSLHLNFMRCLNKPDKNGIIESVVSRPLAYIDHPSAHETKPTGVIHVDLLLDGSVANNIEVLNYKNW